MSGTSARAGARRAGAALLLAAGGAHAQAGSATDYGRVNLELKDVSVAVAPLASNGGTPAYTIVKSTGSTLAGVGRVPDSGTGPVIWQTDHHPDAGAPATATASGVKSDGGTLGASATSRLLTTWGAADMGAYLASSQDSHWFDASSQSDTLLRFTLPAHTEITVQGHVIGTVAAHASLETRGLFFGSLGNESTAQYNDAQFKFGSDLGSNGVDSWFTLSLTNPADSAANMIWTTSLLAEVRREPYAAVPEPASASMTLAGLAVVGAALRRRRRSREGSRPG